MGNYTKIIAVDFDGTLYVGDCWPNIGEPNQVVIDYILAEQERGAKLILWTNRYGESLQNAVDWCAERGIIFDAVNDNIPETLEWYTDAINARKIFAHEYLDDRAKNPNHCAVLYGDNKLQAFVQGRSDELELTDANEVHFPNGDIWKKVAKTETGYTPHTTHASNSEEKEEPASKWGIVTGTIMPLLSLAIIIGTIITVLKIVS